jgi:hypothetical protein
MTHHSALAALLLTSIALAGGLGITNVADDAQPLSAPTIAYLDAPSDEDRELINWAVQRYTEAGLQLPDLEISFPVSCGGKGGRYLVGRNRVELCHPNRKLVLHEFAHAWDDNSNVDREAFLELRGLGHWYEQQDQPSHESGGEQLARIVAWGLMDVDITARLSEWAGQPVDEQPHYLPGLDDSSPATLTDMFERLTGSSPLTPLQTVRGT